MKNLLGLTTVLLVTVAAQAAHTSGSTLPATAGAIARERSSDRSGVDDIVHAHSANTYTIHFRRGERVEIWGHGDGDTDLDLFVRDPRGRHVAADLGLTDQMMVGFRAPVSGTYQIEVRNLGNVWNAFSLTVEHR